jgi:hypothetical protein
VTFGRAGRDAKDAVRSAIVDVEGAIPTARVVRIDDDLVNASDIAERIDRTPESVRQLASGSRGVGGFPNPVGVVGSGVKVWRWADVQQWLAPQGLADAETTLPAQLVAEVNAELARPRHPAPAG